MRSHYGDRHKSVQLKIVASLARGNSWWRKDYNKTRPHSSFSNRDIFFYCWQHSSVAEQGTHKPLVTGSNPVAATFFNSALSRLPIWCHTKVFPQLDICASVWRSNEKLEKRVLPKWRRKHCQDQGRYLFAGRKLGFAGMFLIWKNRKSWLVGYTPKLSR